MKNALLLTAIMFITAVSFAQNLDSNMVINPNDSNIVVNPNDSNIVINPNDSNIVINPNDSNVVINPNDSTILCGSCINPNDSISNYVFGDSLFDNNQSFVDTVTVNPVYNCQIDYLTKIDYANLTNIILNDSGTYLNWTINQGVKTINITGLANAQLTQGENIIIMQVYCNVTKSLKQITLVDSYNVVITAINENKTNNEAIAFYPNPVEEQLNINSTSEIEMVKVTAINGALTSSVLINNTKAQVDMNGFDSGIYSIQVINKNGTSFNKLVMKK